MNCTDLLAAIAVAGFVVASASTARAGDNAAERAALLERARQLEDLRSEDGSPFVLDAKIVATKDKGHASGTYRLTWFAPNRWHEELKLADFSRVRDGVDGGYRQIRSSDYQPPVIFDLDEMLDPAALARIGPKETVGKAHKERIGGVELSCVEILSKAYHHRELCFDPVTGLLVHATLGFGGPREFDYARAVSLGTKQFPAEIKSQRKGDFSLDVAVQSLAASAADEASLPVPDPARSEFWGTCKDAVLPELKQPVNPVYPQESKANHEEGTVLLYARIESDGTVSHLSQLSAPSASLAQASLDAVSRWKYTPDMCGNTPETTETLIMVVFTLGN